MWKVLSFFGCAIGLCFAVPAFSQTWPAGVTPVGGVVTSVSGDVLTLKSASGSEKIHLAKTLTVYTRIPSDLSRVTGKEYVGVTSAKQADGSELATQINIFPESLRGVGEGSYLMGSPQSTGAHRSRMTNGTVSGLGKAAAPRPRMTNGTVTAKSGASTLHVQYGGGVETIRVPHNVAVTAMVATTAKLKPGQGVFVLSKKQPNGSLTASTIVTMGPAK